MKKKFLALSLFAGAILLTACGNNSTTSNSAAEKKEGLKVVTTFYPMYDFTKEVVGDTGTVELLIPAGTEPHDYEPSAQDMAKISDADVFVYNSDDMETFVEDIKANVDEKKTLVIEAADDIDLLEGEAHDHDHEGEEDHDHEGHTHEHDPHVWLDPTLAVKEVEEIRDELSEKYPDHKAAFTKNAEGYISKLKKLDQDFSNGLKDAKERTFVTQHAAFAYLANRYNLEQVAINGISPDLEPSPARLAELKDFVEEHQVKVIYFEENASSKVAETLAKETGVELKVLNPIESLTQKQMDAGENYISTMEKNLEALKFSIK